MQDSNSWIDDFNEQVVKPHNLPDGPWGSNTLQLNADGTYSTIFKVSIRPNTLPQNLPANYKEWLIGKGFVFTGELVNYADGLEIVKVPHGWKTSGGGDLYDPWGRIRIAADWGEMQWDFYGYFLFTRMYYEMYVEVPQPNSNSPRQIFFMTSNKRYTDEGELFVYPGICEYTGKPSAFIVKINKNPMNANEQVVIRYDSYEAAQAGVNIYMTELDPNWGNVLFE